MRSIRSVQLAGLLTLIGGCLWLFTLDMRTLTLAMVLCWAGTVAIYTALTVKRWRTTIGFGLTLLAALIWAVAWLMYNNPLVLFTRTRVGESGQIIDVINFTVGYVAQRDLTILPFLWFGVGLSLMACLPTHVRVLNTVLRFLGFLSISLFGCMVWDRYVDAVVPPLVEITLKLLFGLGWVALGYLLTVRSPRITNTAYRYAVK